MIKTIEVESSIDGIDYPVDKKELVKYAKDKGATSEVLSTLRNLPEGSYDSFAEVESQLKMESDVGEVADKDEDLDEE